MLADGHVRAEQFGVDRARAGAGVVDIVAVDADEGGAVGDEPLGGGGSENG